MSLEFEIDDELDAIVIRTVGVVGDSDFVNSPDQILTVPGFKPGMNQLVDFRSGALKLSESSSREVAAFFESASVREKLGSNYKLALVAARPVDFGQLRMYEVHATGTVTMHGIDLRVFYSMEDARLNLGARH